MVAQRSVSLACNPDAAGWAQIKSGVKQLPNLLCEFTLRDEPCRKEQLKVKQELYVLGHNAFKFRKVLLQCLSPGSDGFTGLPMFLNFYLGIPLDK